MEKTPDMDDMINEAAKDLSELDESGIISEYFQFVGHFEDITTKELAHEHVQIVAKDIAAFQNDPDLPNKLKGLFPEKAANKDRFKGLVDSLNSLSFEEIQFVNPEKEEAIICILSLLADGYRKAQKGEKALKKNKGKAEEALIKNSGINKLLRCIQLIAHSEDLYQKGLPLNISKSEDVALLEKVRLMGFIEGSMASRNKIFENKDLKRIIHSAVSAKKVNNGRWDVVKDIKKSLLSIATEKWENGSKVYHNKMANYLVELVFDELVFDEKENVPRKFEKSGLPKEEEDIVKVSKLLNELRSQYADEEINAKLPSNKVMRKEITKTAHKYCCVRGVHKKPK